MNIFYVIISMYIHPEFSRSDLEIDPKIISSIPFTLAFPTQEACEEELMNRISETNTMSRNKNGTLILSFEVGGMTVKKGCEYVLYKD